MFTVKVKLNLYIDFFVEVKNKLEYHHMLINFRRLFLQYII